MNLWKWLASLFAEKPPEPFRPRESHRNGKYFVFRPLGDPWWYIGCCNPNDPDGWDIVDRFALAISAIREVDRLAATERHKEART